jgi:two-component system sensor histidine kinase DegS
MSNHTTVDGEVSLQAAVEDTQKKYDQAQNELKEIDMLIQQSAAEVERLAQRNAQVSNYIQQLQLNFETTPRADIKEAYEALNSTQQRLFTMRGQLEKLQSDQRNLERLSATQRLFLQMNTSMGGVPISSGGKGGQTPTDQSDVIRVIRAQEAERQSLVRRMHDGPASSLSNFILQAEISQRFFDSDPDRARTELNSLKSAAANTFNSVKNFIFDLRPMMLDDLGVVPTLRRYVESFQEQNKIPVALTVTGTERRLEGHVEVTIFRAVQELLNNARKHAQPTQTQVQLDMGDDRVLAAVEDNGSGFIVDDALASSARDTIGLPSIRERITMLGGNFEIQSSLGQGTRAEFTIPVSAGKSGKIS